MIEYSSLQETVLLIQNYQSALVFVLCQPDVKVSLSNSFTTLAISTFDVRRVISSSRRRFQDSILNIAMQRSQQLGLVALVHSAWTRGVCTQAAKLSTTHALPATLLLLAC